ncbi:MAG: ChrR family anti-sigma-E factor [Gammaproteobacteria bacterium]|nr:ChrR family anti-sigma-E factor [Gammaproteobacteria bacterium]
MNTDVNMHPSSQLLNQFIQGELATGKSIIVSAHMELCKSCCAKAKELEALAVSSWVDPSIAPQLESPSATDYSSMVASIVQSAQLSSEPVEEVVEVQMDVLDDSIKLPKVLAKAAQQGLNWKQVAGGISEAQLILDDETQCEFIYMAPGSKVPVHTHKGSETTLVLKGSFEDELGEYKASDFIVRDTQHHHQPGSKEGCLCFAVLDSPLKFTQGLARFMNPVNSYTFKKAISKAVTS